MERNVQNPGKCISVLFEGPLVLCARSIVVINHLWQLLLCNSLILGDISNLHLSNRVLKAVFNNDRDMNSKPSKSKPISNIWYHYSPKFIFRIVKKEKAMIPINTKKVTVKKLKVQDPREKEYTINV